MVSNPFSRRRKISNVKPVALDMNESSQEADIKIEWKGLLTDEEEKEQMKMLDSLKVMDFDDFNPILGDAQSTAVTNMVKTPPKRTKDIRIGNYSH